MALLEDSSGRLAREDWSDSVGAEHLRCRELGIGRGWSWTLALDMPVAGQVAHRCRSSGRGHGRELDVESPVQTVFMAVACRGSSGDGRVVRREEQTSPSPAPGTGAWRPEGDGALAPGPHCVFGGIGGAYPFPQPRGLRFLRPGLCKLPRALDPARAACPCPADTTAIFDV